MAISVDGWMARRNLRHDLNFQKIVEELKASRQQILEENGGGNHDAAMTANFRGRAAVLKELIESFEYSQSEYEAMITKNKPRPSA